MCVCVCVCAPKDTLGPQLQSQERVLSCKNEEKASGSCKNEGKASGGRKNEKKASGKNESSVAVAAKDRYSIILYHYLNCRLSTTTPPPTVALYFQESRWSGVALVL